MSIPTLRVAEPELPTAPAKRTEDRGSLAPIGGDLLRDVQVSLEAKLGKASVTVDQLLAFKPGSVVTLETGLADHIELHLNGRLVARCEIVAVGDKFGVRIVEIAPVS